MLYFFLKTGIEGYSLTVAKFLHAMFSQNHGGLFFPLNKAIQNYLAMVKND